MKKLILLGLAVLALGSCENETETRYIANEVLVPKGIRIETAEQLAGIGLSEEYPLDGEYYLANDIDLSVLWEEDPDDPPETPYIWRPIGSTCRECRGPLLPTPDAQGNRRYHALPLLCGNRDDCSLSGKSQQPFSGVLNGNGKTISGLKLPEGTTENGYKEALYLGLFGYVYAAYIHDLTVKVANTAVERAVYTGSGGTVIPCIGTLAGLASASRIENVQIKAEGEGMGIYVTGGAAGSYLNYIGGVIGEGVYAFLKNVTSSAPLDVQGVDYEVVGGIAGVILDGTSDNKLAGEISGAKVTGNITVTSTGYVTAVAGISPMAGKIKNCEVEMEELSLTTTRSSSGTVGYAALEGIGYASTLADCTVEIETIKLTDNDTSALERNLYAGGISATAVSGSSFSAITAPMERCRVRFSKLEVSTGEFATAGIVYVGGVAGYLSTASTLSGHSIDGGEISVSLTNKTTTRAQYTGGLAGSGNISRGSVKAVTIELKTATTGAVYAGGLTGNGAAEYSFIGAKGKPAKVKVTKTATTSGATNLAYIGGISGYVSLSATAPAFRYNYAFCDVSLETTAANTSTTTSGNGQSVGGLVGFPYGTATYKTFTESFAAGKVTVTDNCTTNTDNKTRFNVGGVAGYLYNYPWITKCAALNDSITIDASNSSSTSTARYWRRIAVTNTDASIPLTGGSTINNITTVTAKLPSGYMPTDGATNQDGYLVKTPLKAEVFFGTGEGQLDWNKDVWEWGGDDYGYPVLKQ
jgi:hypothetical protein